MDSREIGSDGRERVEEKRSWEEEGRRRERGELHRSPRTLASQPLI